MKIPTEFSGKVYIYWNIRFDFFHLSSMKGKSDRDYIFLGEFDPGVIPLREGRQAAVESLEAQIKEERAASQHRIALLQGRIQELMALEVQS